MLLLLLLMMVLVLHAIIYAFRVWQGLSILPNLIRAQNNFLLTSNKFQQLFGIFLRAQNLSDEHFGCRCTVHHSMNDMLSGNCFASMARAHYYSLDILMRQIAWVTLYLYILPHLLVHKWFRNSDTKLVETHQHQIDDGRAKNRKTMEKNREKYHFASFSRKKWRKFAEYAIRSNILMNE